MGTNLIFCARRCRWEENERLGSYTEMKKRTKKNNKNKTNLKSKRSNFPWDLKITIIFYWKNDFFGTNLKNTVFENSEYSCGQ